MKPIAQSIVAYSLFATTVAVAADPQSIPLNGFADGIHHWQSQADKSGYPQYRKDQFKKIAENILLYQRENGGWASNQDPIRILDPAEKAQLASEKTLADTSFDNRCTYTHIEYLANVFTRTKITRYRDACLKGLDFVLSAQYANGGWPHTFPRTQMYYPHITFQDDVMSGILFMLRKAISTEGAFAWLDDGHRAKCADALGRGDALLLRLQVRVEGIPTVWAGQYDHETLQPIGARKYELPSLSSSESVQVVRYLMSIPNPSKEVVESVLAAVHWFERAKVIGLRIERIPAPKVRYERHTADFDVVATEDPNAPPIWARFYEIGTNRPFMANRDGIPVYNLSEVDRERRTGYSWYGQYATSLLASEYPAWCQKWGISEVKSGKPITPTPH